MAQTPGRLPGQPAPKTSGLAWLAIGLRLALMLAWLIACVVFYYLWRAARRPNPWPRVFLGGIAWLAGVDVTVTGEPARRGSFLLANHVSWIDIPAIAGVIGAAFIAHDGLAAVPLLRWLCAMNDTVFIARHDRASVGHQVEQIRAALDVSSTLAIFPEGTTSDGTALLPFKSSLLSALDPPPPGIAVQPLWLDYGAQTAEIAWVGDEPGLDNFLRILARVEPIRLTLHFRPPLEGAALTNRKTMATASSAAIRQAMAG